ncbi:hypothetical protein [Streptomyces laurentii]|uniref:hypothetical protein n=1 Tax=Streptomyces laurentii TaxID=39478 RepID=UPI0036AAF21B
MKQLKRPAVAVLSAAVLGAAGLAVTAASAHAAQGSAVSMSAPSSPAAEPSATRGYGLDFAYDAFVYPTPSTRGRPVGILHAGIQYIYCWTTGESITDKGHTSDAWLYVSSGDLSGWVSRVYLAPDSYGTPLEHC